MCVPAAGPDRALLRDRRIVVLGLLAVTAAAWVYLWVDAARMEAMPMAAAPSAWAWRPLLMMFLMWAVMMAAMMLPSALPAIVLFGSLAHARGTEARRAPVWIFAGGYLAVWTVFSAGATVLQAWLASSGLLNAMMTSVSIPLSAAVLIVAGLYQWLPVKDACLRRCRSPLQMFLFRWHGGFSGAFRMGAEHGAFCLGCCWALMLVLFAVGVMNLLWVALLAGLVLLEKLVPGGIWIGRAAGLAFAGAGGWLLLDAG